MEELWKKKQSDMLRFLSRVRVWEYRQLPAIHRCTRPTRPDKARRSASCSTPEPPARAKALEWPRSGISWHCKDTQGQPDCGKMGLVKL